MSTGSHVTSLVCRVLLICCLLLAVSCTDTGDRKKGRTPEVTVAVLTPETATLTAELSARVSAFRKAEVRPQVNGILLKQLFTEGSLVREGQSLYKIDPETYAALVSSARAAVESAQARLKAAKLAYTRRKALLEAKAISEQAYEDAEAEYFKARAEANVAKAALTTAEIHLRYTDVLAPITGRIGKSRVTQGALVTANQDEPLAVIQQLDPVYVDMTQSSRALLTLRERYAKGQLTRPGNNRSKIHVTLEDGKVYPHEGEMQFADITVDESTGMVLLRAVFPNPESVLLPGMYVRASLDQGSAENALLVPQVAVRRNAKGDASIFVLKDDSTIEERIIVTGERVGTKWLVTEGLSAGEKIVVQGMQRLKQGTAVRVRTAKAEAKPDVAPGAKN